MKAKHYSNIKFLSNRLILLTILLVSVSSVGNSQTTIEDNKISDAYKNYTESPREIIYVHLNKSTYVNGEMLGFTAYAFDKFTKKRSNLTANLYCTISDLKGNVLKQKLVHIVNGIASNVFHIDDEVLNGNFMFKAYTNWMLNFDEQNHFQQVFYVLNADSQTEIKSAEIDDELDIQILGEGGHLIYNTFNTAGIIVKSKSGRGLPNAEGEIIDDNAQVITNFTLNQFGIAKVILSPENNRKYYVKVYHNDSVSQVQIQNIKTIGFNISISDLNDKLSIKFATNESSFKNLKNKIFKLAIHNGNEISTVPFQFSELSKTLIVPKSELFSGINMFTVFDDNSNPILERLVFNTLGIEKAKTNLIAATSNKDSLHIKLKLENYKLDSFDNMSLSVLPFGTKSYNHQHNLLSQIYLQPYIKTPIQNASYYFKNEDRKTRYELDNLLLTQGWSSYNWTTIFNFENIYKYPFEQGINVTSNVNSKKKAGTYITYPLKGNSSQLYKLTEKDQSILTKGLFPSEDETFKIGYLNKKGEPRQASVYPQFYPSGFPKFNQEYKYYENFMNKLSSEITIPKTPSSWESLEQLDEVVVNAQKEKTKAEKLNEKRVIGTVVELTDLQKNRGTPLTVYLNQLGFYSNFNSYAGTFTITNPRVKWGNPVPLIYLDDALLNDFQILTTMTVETLDYIDYDRSGIGGGVRGSAGYIKIYTSGDYFYRNDGKANTVSEFNFPVTFSEQKDFYTPKYQYYNTTFFNEYGTIDWKPNLKVDTNGIISIKVKDLNIQTVNLYINGVVNDNELLSEIKTINIVN
ncbi:hypothetical protein [Psychroserpens sp.]|uniref:hypothetical protein n=1 Tax=Psychroserpens sp. TaxID=2020870 RepID=UPI0038593B83